MPPERPRHDRTVSRRPCAHTAVRLYVEPSATSCLRCRERGQRWVALWMCLSCGWIACSDGSPNQHARAHYEETDHPVAVGYPRDSHPHWCYLHERAV